jgi:hypothetical protein
MGKTYNFQGRVCFESQAVCYLIKTRLLDGSISFSVSISLLSIGHKKENIPFMTYIKPEELFMHNLFSTLKDQTLVTYMLNFKKK